MPVSDSVLQKLNGMSPIQRRATLDALNAILGSRQAAVGSKGAGVDIGQDMNVEIDPELNKTQNKASVDGSSVDVDDPENLMNKEEEESEDDSSEGADSSSGGQDSQDKSSDDDKENGDKEDTGEGASGGDKNQGANNKQDNASKSTNNSNAYDKSEQSTDEKSQTSNSSSSDEANTEEDESSANDSNSNEKSSEQNQGEDSEAEDSGIDDDVDLFNTKEAESKQQQRNTHDINRTINEGEAVAKAKKQALQNGDKSISQSAIDDLEKSVEDLKNHKEEYSKLSEDKLNEILNKVIDKIDALNPLYKSDKSLNDREISMEKEFDSGTITKDIEKEERGNKQKDILAQKARDKEINKYSSFNSIQDFEIDLYDTVRDQVEMVKKRNDTYSRINSRYEQEPVIMPGSIEELEESPEKPKIQVYFDQSGSWGANDIQIGNRALKVLQEMEEKGDITVEIFYFSNVICTSADDYRLGSGTGAWNEIIKNIKASDATNVVLMTDSDMDYQARNSSGVTVPGTVWIIWRDGDHSDDIVRKLRGEGGTYQYSFKSTE